MGRQITTTISDGVLAITSFHASVTVFRLSPFGAIGFFIIGIAASLGTVRFTFAEPNASLRQWHESFAWLASVVGLSFLAVGFWRQEGGTTISNIHVAAAVALVILSKHLFKKSCHIATEAVSGAAVLSMFLCSIVHLNPYGLVGSILYIISGLAVKTEGELYGVLRVDIFHYMLVLANIACMLALKQAIVPILYSAKGERE